ncbi:MULTISPECIES: phage capsid protein [unclassified Acinetobacter]|uniref:phage capsid protein n=1 Tax=unclassified Acinetobacter TaxID=196816 RepID=UPI0015D40100|nr:MULTISPECIES: phage capsid protein [unclassified Acinetobacter]
MAQDMATNGGMITAAFKRQFHDAFEIQCQQTQSVLQVLAHDRGQIQGSSFTVNDLGAVEMEKMTTRFADTKWSVPEAGTRLAVMEDYGLFVPIDPRDEAKLSANPTSPYMQACLAAEHRQRDRVIYKSLGASVQRKTADGESYTATPVPAGQTIAASATPMNKAKIAKARALFRKNQCDNLPLYMIYNSEILEQILVDDELTKWDRDTIQQIQDGDVAKKWGGFIWLPYEELADGAGGVTEGRTFAVAKGATHYGRNTISNFDIVTRADKSNVKQIGGIASYGAARANEQKIVLIDFLR